MTNAGSRVRMVAAVVLRTGADGADELLILDRPGAPQIPAGAIADGEDADDAALRVLQEQAGLAAEVRTLVATVDEVAGGEQRRRSIYVLDADEGGPAEWTHAGTMFRWARLDAVGLDEAQQPWLDLVRADLA